MQEFDIKMDEEFLVRMIYFIYELKSLIKSGKHELQVLSKEATRIYIKTLHLHPCKANIWYKNSANVEDKFLESVQAMGIPISIIPNLDHSRISFDGILIRDIFSTLDDVAIRMRQEYGMKFIRQVGNLLGSLEIIGSPAGFLNNLGSSINYLPEHLGGPLMKQTAFGVASAVSDVSGSVARGVTAITADKPFAKEMEKIEMQETPTTIGEGISMAAKTVEKGFEKGATAISEETKGRDSIGEMLKGLSKGVMETFSRPIRGIIEATTTQPARAIQSQLQTDNQPKRRRNPQKK